MARPKRTEAAPTTTAQRLSSIVKSCRDVMRKDKGLNGDLDRLPMLTWILFLKFLDDLEAMDEQKSKMTKSRFRPAIDAPYRWRDWAAPGAGVTGEQLISFVNNDEAVRPDGVKGPGLFKYLRGLRSTEGGRRDVVATVFRGTVNRMINGYLLRDVVDKVGGIHFTSSDEIHTLGHLYETMLREMRDAAGDSGEFYTPRPLVRFMVEVTNPRLGEVVLDPACGTGGFLVETFRHLAAQARTVAHRTILQEKRLLGGEAKSLPYLLAQMNLLLHGVEAPKVDPGNSLAVRLNEVGDRDRVDVILTNPPFGGEEEVGIQSGFPADRGTGATELLFLQLIMRKLRRVPRSGFGAARAAVVVPNGTLFADGVAARVKGDLLQQFNLHTILRLPNGVFTPYTGIPTNVLFFDRSGPTKEIWYYEHPLPAGRKSYTKTQPLQYEDFADCLAWWGRRVETDRAWRVSATEIRSSGVNLDQKNPSAAKASAQKSPDEVLARLIDIENEISEILRDIKTGLEGDPPS